jgi:hypothetical protein
MWSESAAAKKAEAVELSRYETQRPALYMIASQIERATFPTFSPPLYCAARSLVCPERAAKRVDSRSGRSVR